MASPIKWMRDKKPIEREVVDEDNNVGKIWVIRFSEADLREREKFLSAPVSTEESRRGRSSRARQKDSTIQIQRLRQFNFENGLYDWDFVFPEEVWDEREKAYVRHEQAGEKVPVRREYIEMMGATISTQIEDILAEINEPPAELPEVRDEAGNIVEPAVETPMVASLGDR